MSGPTEKATMRKPKKAGEEVEVDYAGLTVPVTNPETGGTHAIQIFVGVLGFNEWDKLLIPFMPYHVSLETVHSELQSFTQSLWAPKER